MAFSDSALYKTHSITQLFFGVKADLSHYPALLDTTCRRYVDGNGQLTDRLSLEHFCEDATLTKEGKSLVKIGLLNAQYADWKKLSGSDYLQKKIELAEIYAAKLAEVMPETLDNIEMIDVSTPLTFERYTGVHEGAYIGYELSPSNKKQFLSNRIKQLPNVVLASQWNMISGGWPSAILSGKAAIQRLAKLEKQAFKGVQ